MCVFVIKHKTHHHCNNRASCCSTPALPTPWLGVPTASWWVAATRRLWPTVGRVMSYRPSTTTTTALKRSLRWRPPAPAASQWCLAASTGQLLHSNSSSSRWIHVKRLQLLWFHRPLWCLWQAAGVQLGPQKGHVGRGQVQRDSQPLHHHQPVLEERRLATLRCKYAHQHLSMCVLLLGAGFIKLKLLWFLVGVLPGHSVWGGGAFWLLPA